MDNIVLKEFYRIISPNKIKLFEKNAELRTKFLTVVIEDIYQKHNASAVVRTCDCFGIQDLYTIEKRNEFISKRDVAQGAGQWIKLHKFNSQENPTNECLSSLKKKGYKIVATSPHEQETNLTDLALDKPLAFVFGTEMEGVSSEVSTNADYFVKIPMYGFTESYNISVAVALTLQTMRERLQNENIPFKLSKDDQTKLKILWSTKVVRDGEKIEKEIRKRIIDKTN